MNITCEEQATNFDLWGEYIDPHATMTEADFEAMTIENKIALIHNTFEDDPDYDTHVIITAVKGLEGWYLQDSDGNFPQDGFNYPTEEEGYNACRQLWPNHSPWYGTRIRQGYIIERD